jgi:hypothetical protein
MSVMFFATIVKEKAQRNQTNLQNNTDLSNYKRLLDKVSNKIEKWHHDHKHRNKVLFTKDDEYIEDEKSPMTFSSSSSSSSDSEPSASPEIVMRNTKTHLPKSGFSLNLVQTELHTKTENAGNKSQIIYRPK